MIMRMRYITSLFLFLLIAGFYSTIQAQTVEIDKLDYAPGETVYITGTGWASGEQVILQVIHLGDYVDHGDLAVHDPWTVEADTNGSFTSTWFVSEYEAGAELLLIADGQTSGARWEVFFTDAIQTRIRSLGPSSGQCSQTITVVCILEYMEKGNWYRLSNKVVTFTLGSNTATATTGTDGTATTTILVPSGATSLAAKYEGPGGNDYGPSSTSIVFTAESTIGNAEGISGSNSICANSTEIAYSIQPVNEATYYTWTVPSGASITSGQGTTSIVVTFGTSSGNVTVTPSNECGSGGSSSLMVTVVQLPTASLTTNNLNFCQGEPVTLNITLTGAGTISGALNDGTTFSGEGGTTINVVVYPTATMTYTIISLTDGTCLGTFNGSTVVTLKGKYTSDAGSDQTICPGSEASLNGTTTGSPTATVWTTNGTGTFADANAPSTVYTPSTADVTAGSVILTLTASGIGNCDGTDYMVLKIEDKELPTFTAPADITLYKDASCTVNDTPAGSAGDVTNEADNCSTGLNATYADVVVTNCEGTYTITRTWSLVDNCGNAAADQVQIITVLDNIAPIITVPSTITVNYSPAECGKTVTYSVSATDNCSGTVVPTFKSGLPSGSVFQFGTTEVTWEAVDACGNTSEKSFNVVVNPAQTTSTLTVTPGTAQYSDLVTLKVVITDGASLCAGGGPNAATSATFTINGQAMHTANSALTEIPFVINEGDLEAILITPLLDYLDAFGNGVMKPGDNKTVSAVINGIASEFEVSQPAITSLNITQEDARVDYTGDIMKATASSTTYSAIVTLRANIFDISATSEAGLDTYPGDIRNARVMFVDRDASNAPISGWINVATLVNSADSRIGTVSFDYYVNGLTSTTPYKFITVGIIVNNGGYYIRNNPDDNVVVTVYTPVGDFITGGGYIVPTQSVGTMKADAGSKVNFGFNVKFKSGGKNLGGNMNIIFRRTVDGVVHNYQIKANAMLSLGVNASNPLSQTAEYVSKTNLTDLNTGEPLGGNLYLYVKMTDNGEPGRNDLISFVLVEGTKDPTILSNIIFSSNWMNSKTEKLNLIGGNLVVHSGFSVNATSVKSTESEAIMVPQAELGLKVYPNPFKDHLYFDLRIPTDSRVRLEIFDLTGAIIATVFDNNVMADESYFIEYIPENIMNGVFMYRLIIDGKIMYTGKVIRQDH